MTKSLLSLTSFQAGTTAQHDVLYENAQAIATAIEGVVADAGQNDSPSAAAEVPSPSVRPVATSVSDWQQLMAQLPPKDIYMLTIFLSFT